MGKSVDKLVYKEAVSKGAKWNDNFFIITLKTSPKSCFFGKHIGLNCKRAGPKSIKVIGSIEAKGGTLVSRGNNKKTAEKPKWNFCGSFCHHTTVLHFANTELNVALPYLTGTLHHSAQPYFDSTLRY